MTQVLHDLCQENFKRGTLPFEFPAVSTSQQKVSVSVVVCVSSHWVANNNYGEEGYINRAEEALEYQVSNNYIIFQCFCVPSSALNIIFTLLLSAASPILGRY